MKKRILSEAEAMEKRISSLKRSVGIKETSGDHLEKLREQTNTGQHIIFGRKVQ